MVVTEAARADLYHGLAEVLGTDRAETLMAALPSYDISDLATKGDIAVLGTRMEGLEARMGALETGLGARMDALEAGLGARIDALEGPRMAGLETRMTGREATVLGLGEKMDRLFLTLVTGLFVIVAAMVGVFVTVQAM